MSGRLCDLCDPAFLQDRQYGYLVAGLLDYIRPSGLSGVQEQLRCLLIFRTRAEY